MLITLVFCINTLVYGIDVSYRSHLRPPLISRIKKTRTLVATIASSIKEGLIDPTKDISSLFDVITNNSKIKGILDAFNINMGFDSFARPWIYCKDIDYYLFIDRYSKKIISSTAEDLINACTINGLVRLIEVFIDDDGLLEKLENKLLRRAEQGKTKLVLSSLLGGLANPNPECIKFTQRLILKIPRSRIEGDIVDNLLVGTLADVERRKAVKEIILKRLETYPDGIIKRLGIALSRPERTEHAKRLLLKGSRISEQNLRLVKRVVKTARIKDKRKPVAKATEEILGLIDPQAKGSQESKYDPKKVHRKRRKKRTEPTSKQRRDRVHGRYRREDSKAHQRELNRRL